MLQVPKLTIIMPVYNTAQYLPRAFEALNYTIFKF